MHSYEVKYRQKMNCFRDQLWNQLTIIPTLDLDLQKAVLSYLIELACQSQNDINIEIGRQALLNIPRQWLLSHIESITEPLYKLEDSWEYRRLLELYWLLNKELARKLAVQGLNNRNLDIEEAAKDFLENLTQAN